MNIRRHMTTTVTVEPIVGEGAYGPVFGDPVDVPCWPEQSTKLVRSFGGEEVTSSTRLWCEAEHERLFSPSAKVLFRGEETGVISVTVHDPGALRQPRLLEVALL